MDCDKCNYCANFKEIKPTIYVPENIHFTKSSISSTIGLLFNNSKQELFFNFDKGAFGISTYPRTGVKIKTKLVPCVKKDVGVGEWGYTENCDCQFSTVKVGYCLNIGESLVCISNESFIIPYTNYKYWWKVVEID